MNRAKAESAFSKRTIAAALANYIDAGSIVAGSAGLSMWVSYLKLSDSQIGLLGALSANAISAAIGRCSAGIWLIRSAEKLYTQTVCSSTL